MTTTSKHIFWRSLAAVVACAATAALAAPAVASAAPIWKIDALANSTVPTDSTPEPPDSTLLYQLQIMNVGDRSTSPAGSPPEPTQLEVTLPTGMTAASVSGGGFSCPGAVGLSNFVCNNPGTSNNQRYASYAHKIFQVNAKVAVGASGPGTASFEIEGGGATSPVATYRRTTITDATPTFGVVEFDGQVAANAEGAPYTQAAGTPYAISTAFDFATTKSESLPNLGLGSQEPTPVEVPRTVVVDLPPGLLGNPAAIATCDAGQLLPPGVTGDPLCPSESQVGTVDLPTAGFGGRIVEPTALYNMAAPPDVPARFGFNLAGTIVTLDAEVRSGSDFGVTIASRGISQAIPVNGTRLTFWGVPSDPSHDLQRSCPGAAAAVRGGQSVAGPNSTGQQDACTQDYVRPELTSLLRLPTSCVGPVETSLYADSWTNPARLTDDRIPDLSDPNWKQISFMSHNPPAYPAPPEQWGSPQGVTGCSSVPFNPQVNVTTTSSEADAPTGLDFSITVPQVNDPSVLGSSDLKDTVVTLPEGFTLNPSASDGLADCSLEQIDLEGRNTVPECPNASKIGTTEIDTPLLAEPMKGSVYLATPNNPQTPGAENPFDTLSAYYIVAEGPGTVIKLPGKVELDPDTGQITNTFEDNPQLPFNTFKVSFFEGPRSPIATPKTCGTGQLITELTPWARPNDPVARTTNLQITEGANGQPCSASEADRPFEPAMNAGTTSNQANSYSPFVLRLTRPQGHQELSALEVDMPPGLTSKLAAVSECSDETLASISQAEGTGQSEVDNPSCPANSLIGKSIVGVGAGAPYYVQTGKTYLAGPYKGAPLSLAVVVPSIAGPFDLGTTVVRSKVNVDPRTAQISVESDPLPQILSGIPLRIQDLRIKVDRNEFMLTPTNCDPMKLTSNVEGANGATADLSNHYQVAGCGDLGFSPKLDLSFGNAKKNTKPNSHPPLNAKLSFNEGDSNISSVEVALPQGLFLDQDRLGRICSRANYAANTCPEESRVGYAKAITPLLDDPVEGPVYLKASDNPLPDLAADLNGQIDVDLFGKIDQKQNKKGLNQIRNTFDIVPDVPVSDFELKLDGGSDGLLVNSRNICKSKKAQKVSIDMTAHNEMTLSEKPLIGSACQKLAKKNKKKAKKLEAKAKRLLRKAKKADNPKKAKKLRKQARKLKRQARKLGR